MGLPVRADPGRLPATDGDRAAAPAPAGHEADQLRPALPVRGGARAQHARSWIRPSPHRRSALAAPGPHGRPRAVGGGHGRALRHHRSGLHRLARAMAPLRRHRSGARAHRGTAGRRRRRRAGHARAARLAHRRHRAAPDDAPARPHGRSRRVDGARCGVRHVRRLRRAGRSRAIAGTVSAGIHHQRPNRLRDAGRADRGLPVRHGPGHGRRRDSQPRALRPGNRSCPGRGATSRAAAARARAHRSRPARRDHSIDLCRGSAPRARIGRPGCRWTARPRAHLDRHGRAEPHHQRHSQHHLRPALGRGREPGRRGDRPCRRRRASGAHPGRARRQRGWAVSAPPAPRPGGAPAAHRHRGVQQCPAARARASRHGSHGLHPAALHARASRRWQGVRS